MRFKLPLYISLFFDWYLTIWTINNLVQHDQEKSYFNIIGSLIVVGFLAGSNINVSHELIHKEDKLDQFLGTLTLFKNLYTHWQIEHTMGHHRNVATPKVNL